MPSFLILFVFALSWVGIGYVSAVSLLTSEDPQERKEGRVAVVLWPALLAISLVWWVGLWALRVYLHRKRLATSRGNRV